MLFKQPFSARRGGLPKLIFYLGLVALLVGLAYLTVQAVKRGSKGGGRSNIGAAAVAVETAPIRTMDMLDVGRFTGSLLPKSRFLVAPKIAGRLKKLECDIGDRIEFGRLIAEIEDEEFIQELAQAEADLAIAKANLNESLAMLEIGRREFERIKAMRLQKVSSEAEVDAAQAVYKSREAKVEVNKAQVLQKEAAVKTAQIRLSYTKIQAIWDDKTSMRTVGEKFQDVGAMLSVNTPILSLLDVQTVTAAVDVVERDYFKLHIGQSAIITSSVLPGRSFQGKVTRMSPALSVETRQARVEIEIPNADFTLKPGMFVSVQIEFSKHSNVTAVPISAIVTRDGQKGVFVADEEAGKAVLKTVETGITYNDFVEIASPPISGSIVTLGHHLLEDGSPIRIVSASNGESAEKKGSAQR